MSNTNPPETVEVDAHAETVGCDGGGGGLGHPMVYYSFGTGTAVDCGYCGRHFVKRREAAEDRAPARPESADADESADAAD